MEPMEKNVEKQLIIRCFLPDMQKLKATAKQLALTPDIKLSLYGQAGEVLVVANACAYAAAAATELTENAAQQFEDALGEAVYGRGKGSLAYVTAGELIENECVIAAADEITGKLLANEFGNTKRGPKVFDFGASSYDNDKIAAKIEAASDFGEEDTSPEQRAADRASAAAKCTRSDFGAAVTGLEGDVVWVAVAHKGKVYLRRVAGGKDAPKAAALTVLDITRRLLRKADLPYVKMFRAGKEVDWDSAPRPQKGSGNKYLVPVLVLVALVIALLVALWYLYNTFFIDNKGESQAVSGSSSVSQMAESGSAGDASAPAEGTDPTVATGEGGENQTQAPQSTANSGVVHPFA